LPKIPGIDHLDAVRALRKAGFVIVRDAGLPAEQFRDLL